MQFRHEYKHILNHGDYLVTRTRLRSIMEPDIHADADGRCRIRSLYFDSMTDRALLEKISGVSEREKFRIRCYDGNHDFIRLEKKVKKGGLGYKVSAMLSQDDTRRIISGDLEWMKDSREALVVEFYGKMKFQGLRPRTIVDYTREPYVCRAGNVRVTLDYDIRTGAFCTDMLRADVPVVPVNPGLYVLEVKYDDFLPDMIRDIVQLGNREENAFSKYAACRMFG